MKKSRATQGKAFPEPTGKKQGGCPPEEFRFKPGQSGNPAGRKKGSRNALTEAFLEALHADFLEHGMEAVIAARIERPSAYLGVIAGLLPKQIEVDEERHIYVISDRPLSVDDWAKKYAGIEEAVEKPSSEALQ